MFFLMTSLLILYIESINLNVVLETASSVLEVAQMTHVLEVFVNVLDLLTLVLQIKA